MTLSSVHIHTEKPAGIPTESMHFFNNRIYDVHVTVLLCVFCNDNEEKMPVKQITNWTVFGEIQTGNIDIYRVRV